MSQRRSSLLAVVVWLIPTVALAHNVKTSGNIAANFHIEPNHNPRAGQPSQAWFALTKAGGELVPLEQCNCKLTVYDSQKQAVLNPPLKPISAEQYRGIPGVEIVFPKAGIYKLELSGTPKTEGNFTPFKLAYEVTVRTAQAPVEVPSEVVSEQTRRMIPVEAIATGGAAIAAAGATVWLVKRSRKKSAKPDNEGE